MNCNRTKGSNSLAQVGHINHLSLVSYKEFISQVMNWNNATMKTVIQGRDIPIRFNNKCKEKFTPTTKENPTYTIIDSNTAMSLYTTVGRRLLPKTTSSRWAFIIIGSSLREKEKGISASEETSERLALIMKSKIWESNSSLVMLAIMTIERLEVRFERSLGVMACKKAGSKFKGKDYNKPHNIVSN